MGVFEKAFLNYALGDDESDAVAVNHELFAQKLWNRYMSEISRYEKNIVRVGLPPLNQLREEVLKTMLGPDYGLDPILIAQLRTRLNLPPDFGVSAEAPSTNAPPAAAQGTAPGGQQ